MNVDGKQTLQGGHNSNLTRGSHRESRTIGLGAGGGDAEQVADPCSTGRAWRRTSTFKCQRCSKWQSGASCRCGKRPWTMHRCMRGREHKLRGYGFRADQAQRDVLEDVALVSDRLDSKKTNIQSL